MILEVSIHSLNPTHLHFSCTFMHTNIQIGKLVGCNCETHNIKLFMKRTKTILGYMQNCKVTK